MHSLYPAIEPFHHQYLTVSALHQIYLEQCGNPQGIPVIFLHGGPGSGCREQHRSYFDSAVYHIILFDQRGCGRSLPQGEIEENTTSALVEDIETIRQHLNIEQWLVFGGSWGATLALVYAKHYPKQVLGMILRGVFLGRPQDIDWVYSEKGAAQIFPEAWQQLVEGLPETQQKKPLKAIYQQLNSSDKQVSNAAYNRLQHWEATILNIRSYLTSTDSTIDATNTDNNTDKNTDRNINKNPAIIQLHYSINDCFILQTPILEQLNKIHDIPLQIIQGRYDFVCPAEQAWQLSNHCQQAKLTVIELAGHLANEPAMIDALIDATINFAKKYSKNN